MPKYMMWSEVDNKEDGPVDARDDAEAVAKLSAEMGVSFTLEEGPKVAKYMMRRIDGQGPQWAGSPTIPVWVRENDE